jgi:hypothetical protein
MKETDEDIKRMFDDFNEKMNAEETKIRETEGLGGQKKPAEIVPSDLT